MDMQTLAVLFVFVATVASMSTGLGLLGVGPGKVVTFSTALSACVYQFYFAIADKRSAGTFRRVFDNVLLASVATTIAVPAGKWIAESNHTTAISVCSSSIAVALLCLVEEGITQCHRKTTCENTTAKSDGADLAEGACDN